MSQLLAAEAVLARIERVTRRDARRARQTYNAQHVHPDLRARKGLPFRMVKTADACASRVSAARQDVLDAVCYEQVA